MHITFIEPTWNYDIHCMSEPLGIMYLTSVLRKAGHKVSMIHTLYEELNADLIQESDVIGFYSSTPQFDNAIALLKRVKAIAPLTPVIAGGPHATVQIEDTLKAGFHAAFYGEAEISLPEFLDNLKKECPFETRGIAYLDGDKIVKNPPPPLIEDLDTLPFPARDIFDYKAFLQNGGWEFGMMGSRGCINHCTFCQPTINMIFTKYRKRSAENVAEEIRDIYENYEPPLLYFKDDTMAMNGPDWFKTLKQKFNEYGIEPHWRCNNRVDMCSEETVSAMVDAGCCQMALGVESGSQKILDFYRKGIKVEDTKKAFTVCRKYGIEPSANILIGAPVETREDLEMTFDLVMYLKPNDYWIFILTVLPGKWVTEYAIEHNLLKKDMGYHFCDTAINGIRGETNITHKYLTQDDLIELRERIFEKLPQRQRDMAEVYRKLGYVPAPKEVENVINKLKRENKI